MTARALLLASLLATGSLESCSTLKLEAGSDLDVAATESLEVGRTSRADVLATLGAPMGLGVHDHGLALLYQQVALKENQFGLGLGFLGDWFGAQGIGFFKVSLGGSGSRREALLLLFDEDQQLSGVAAMEWSEKFGRGGSVQVLFDVDSVVDVGDLRRPPVAMVWGRELLQPLAEGLNRASRPDVELRGRPLAAGQRTLEHTDVTEE